MSFLKLKTMYLRIKYFLPLHTILQNQNNLRTNHSSNPRDLKNSASRINNHPPLFQTYHEIPFRFSIDCPVTISPSRSVRMHIYNNNNNNNNNNDNNNNNNNNNNHNNNGGHARAAARTISSLAASLSPSSLFEAIDLSSRFRAGPDNPAITIYYLLAWV